MRASEPASPPILTRSLLATALAALLVHPAAAADPPFERDGLLEDSRVSRALERLRYQPAPEPLTPETFETACWQAAAAEKTRDAQRTACLYAAAQLFGKEARFLVAKESRPFDAGPLGLTGIGVSIKKSDAGVEVMDLLPQGPAHRAGAAVGDRLTHADGQALADLPIDEVTARLRGEPGSRLRLDAVSKNGQQRHLDIERRSFTWPGEMARPIRGGWYLQIRLVDRGAAGRVRELIEQAHARGELGGTLVLDLRGNSGGLADEMVDLARVLLHRDDIEMTLLAIAGTGRGAVSRVGGAGARSERAAGAAYRQAQTVFQALPLVVLADEQTASGSSWLLATLRAHRNTHVLGGTTSTSAIVLEQINAYGSGEGVFRLPSAYLYARGGEPLHGVGIAPDVPQASEAVISAQPPSWLEAALAAHAPRFAQPRLTPAVAPGGASAGAQARQCIGPLSLAADSAPRWVRVKEHDNRISLGEDTRLFVFEHSRAEHQAMLAQSRDALLDMRQAQIRNETERLAALPTKRPPSAAEKGQLQRMQADLERLRNTPDEAVPGHPGAVLLNRVNPLERGDSSLWWWHDGFTYVIEGRLEDKADPAPLTAWLERFTPGTPAGDEGTPRLCLPNATLALPPGVGPVQGGIRFRLAATGDDTWFVGFSSEPASPPRESRLDEWLLRGEYRPSDHLLADTDCKNTRRPVQRYPVPQAIAGRPGVALQLDGGRCGLIRATMLPALDQPDPWHLAFGLSHAQPAEGTTNGLDAWRRTLGTVRWRALPLP